MAGKLVSLIIKIAADGASAEKELRQLERKMSDFSKNLKKIGTDMSKYITAPITAMAGVSVAAANTQLQAEAKLLTALQGRSDVQQRLIAQASELQSRSTLGDEAIIEQQAYLAALGLSEQQIGATIEAAAQLSAALDIDLGSAVKNLGKTFGGMTGELGESIPALKNLTKEQLQAGEAVNYVNQNYRGFAEAAAAVGTGPLTQIKNIIGDIAESFGVILLPTVQKIAAKLKEMATAFQNLSPQIKAIIVSVATFVAAIGPMTTAFAKLLSVVKLVALIFPSVGSAIAALTTGPLGAAVAVVASLAAAWVVARQSMKAYYEEEGLTTRKSRAAFKDTYKHYKDATDEVLEEAFNDIAKNYDRAKTSGKSVDYYEGAYKALVKIREERAKANGEISVASTIEAQIQEILAGQVTEVKTLTAEVKKFKSELSTINIGSANLSSLSAAPALNIGVLDAQLAESIQGTTGLAAFRQYWEQLKAEADKTKALGEEIADIMRNTLGDLAVSLGEGIGDLYSGIDIAPGKRFLEILGKSLQQLGSALIAYAVAMKEFKMSLSQIFNAPGIAIAAGIAAIATGKWFMNMAKEPIKLATGGLAYGPTLAVVGDNRGAASDPEVIAPLSKLRNYMGGQQLELVGDVEFKMHGDTVVALLNRENMRLKRKG